MSSNDQTPPRRRPAPPRRDKRRETAERLSEKIGGEDGRTARDALREDPDLPDPDRPKSERPRRGS